MNELLNQNKFTPAKIAEQYPTLVLRIPLYQRLFEWDREQIEQLLRDLDSAMKQDKSNYYIGLLTTKRDNNFLDLVDGQQRFTVLMLLGIVFGWSKFLLDKDNSPRLTFFARKNDEKYLNEIIKNPKFGECAGVYKNAKMDAGITVIRNFIRTNFDNDQARNNYKDYIYNHLTFFVSELPNEYTMTDLNKYFESMNSTGKGLENHEILLVELLKKLPKELNERYTRIWNTVAQMDKKMVRQRSYRNENTDDFIKRFQDAIVTAKNNPEKVFGKKGQCLINDLFDYDNSNQFTVEPDETPRIKDIPANAQKPTQKLYSEGDRSFLTFSEFLLQILFLTLSKEEQQKIRPTDFYDVHKLLTTFYSFENLDIKVFIDNLLVYRLLFDFYFIRIKNDDGSYLLENLKEVNPEQKKQLIQYQSMLYVSSSTLTYHRWLKNALHKVYEKPDIGVEKLLEYLKNEDDAYYNSHIGILDEILNKLKEEKPISNTPMSYGAIDRYWFWRLDYYLWEDREKYFKKDEKIIADNYIFRRNRSIEHVAPQNPQHNTTDSLKWDETKQDDMAMRDCFGNLCMISGGQNSSLKNESYDVKHAYVKSFIVEDKNGTIESLKLLKLFQDKEHWNRETIKEHFCEMIIILRSSFSHTNP